VQHRFHCTILCHHSLNSWNSDISSKMYTSEHKHIQCPVGNVPDFGWMLLKLKYTGITKNKYIRSWTVMEIMVRKFESTFDIYVTSLWRFRLQDCKSDLYNVCEVDATPVFTRWVALNVIRKLKSSSRVEQIWLLQNWETTEVTLF